MRHSEVLDRGKPYDPSFPTIRESTAPSPNALVNRLHLGLAAVPGRIWLGLLLSVLLLAAEALSFSAARFALVDLFGNISFMGWRWATVLALALCAVDFAGLAYMFTLDRSLLSGRELFYLLGVWIIAATMNAFLAWWTFSTVLLVAGVGQVSADPSALLMSFSLVVAITLWVIRILLIRVLSMGPDGHLINQL